MFTRTLLALALASTAWSAQAVTVTQWNFNSVPSDASTATGTLTPSTGAGSIAAVGTVTGISTPSFASGAGSSDTAAADNSALQTTTYAAQGTGDKTAGVQFNVSTVGFDTITFSYDTRHSGTASRYEEVQYSLNGSTFIDLALIDNSTVTLFQTNSVSLAGIAGVANNASFALRVVATFAPGTSTYGISSGTAAYGTGGTWRFDAVTVSGNAIAAVPEPESYALMLAGLGAIGFVASRRRG